MMKAEDARCVVSKREKEAPERNKVIARPTFHCHVQDSDRIKGIASCEMLLCECLAVQRLPSSLLGICK